MNRKRDKGKGRTDKGSNAKPHVHTQKPQHNVVWGRNPVFEWLESGLVTREIFLSRDAGGRTISEILKVAEQKHIPVKRLHPAKLDQMAGTDKHQNIMAQVDLPDYVELDDIYAIAEQKGEPLLIGILDGVQDPHNLGAILRSADAAGIHGIIIPKDKAVGLTPTVLKSSAGAAAWVPVAVVTNLSRTIDELKDNGVWITGTADDASKSYAESDLKGPTAIVLGGEGKGMRRLVREKCDFLVGIPMHGKVSSLNVSVAAGLLFFEASRQRLAV